MDLRHILFPSLRKFLLSTSDLTSLSLDDIPNDGYISPEAMVTSLSALTSSNHFHHIHIPDTSTETKNATPTSWPRTVLSALTNIYFQGVSEYLEVLAARIDAPMLEALGYTFSISCLRYSTNQLAHWYLRNPSHPVFPAFLAERPIERRVRGKWLDWQVFSIAQICNQILPLCSSVEWLNVEYGNWWAWEIEPPPSMRPDDMDDTRWLELFHSFISVKRLEISNELESFIAAALQGLTKESAAGVFPTLNRLSIIRDTLDRAAHQGIESFVNARQHSDYPKHFISIELSPPTPTPTALWDDIYTWEWKKLVQVCRRWRYIIFGSPLSLDLQLLCTRNTRVRDLLDIWPVQTLPLVLDIDYSYRYEPASYWENKMDHHLSAALERSDRIRQIRLHSLGCTQFERVAEMMRERSFPALTHLSFGKYDAEWVVVIDPFLNGSAPRLQHLYLWRVVIPSLPNLLLSVTDLTTLRLLDIPADSYISPETMATCLSALTKLNRLDLHFLFPTPGSNLPSPFPTLAPSSPPSPSSLFKKFEASYFDPLDPIDQLEFDISQAVRFIGYRELPKPKYLQLVFWPNTEVKIAFCRHDSGEMKMDDQSLCFEWRIQCDELDGQVSYVVDVCSQIAPICSTIGSSILGTAVFRMTSETDTWTHGMSRPVPLVYLCEDAGTIERAGTVHCGCVGEVSDELVAEVFPALETIFIHKEILTRMRPGISRGMKSFVATRQLAGRPVDVKEN
ncbi:hypothetical protein BGW80DRAFT_1461541 [Lactifluus volemus]|nr:hypothetical protein BGW80DRAFT_1461541 [Lactifluus volemus]